MIWKIRSLRRRLDGGPDAVTPATFTGKYAAVARKGIFNRLGLPNVVRGRAAMDWKAASRIFFAVTMIAIGIIGFAGGGFAAIWEPVPKAAPGRELLAYLCALVALACGAGLLVRRTAAAAALVLLISLLVWTVLFKAPFIVRAPLEEVSYQSTGENLVLVAAAWILLAEFASTPKILAGTGGLRIAYLLYGLALIAFGLSHFVYLDMTAPLVPGWLPGPSIFWAYLTGGIYFAAGVMVAAGIAVRLGAMIAAVQIALITLLVWGLMIFAGPLSQMHWQETIVSWALTAGAWVIASGSLPSSGAWAFLPRRSR
jgi:uncharacterized membrane protein